MPSHDTLTPLEAAYIATNAYFTLQDWITGKPRAGAESLANVKDRVLGDGSRTGVKPGEPTSSLKQTDLRGGKIVSLHEGVTGATTRTGFGYTLSYHGQGVNHAVVAMRGTRAEYGLSDIWTDLRGAMTPFASYGCVHKGFKRTFDSLVASVDAGGIVHKASVVHVVGHSLGGAVATLIAAHFAARGKDVKLYTFGSPRVGAWKTFDAMHKTIGKQNIYRVAHDLDPVSLVGPFPYIHVNPAATDANNMTLRSPTGHLFSVDNHDMQQYIRSVSEARSWEAVRGLAKLVDHDNAVLSRWLLHPDNDPGWLAQGTAKALGLLFKLFANELRSASTSLILGLSALDLFAEILIKGLYKLKQLHDTVMDLMWSLAKWAGIKAKEGAEYTASIVALVMEKMLAFIKQLGMTAVQGAARGLKAYADAQALLGPQYTLMGYGVF